MHELHELADRRVVALEDRLHGPVASVRDPAADAVAFGDTLRRVPEEHALNESVDDHAPANHGAYSRRIELREILERRRMVRAYQREPVPRDAIERIVGTVRRAPSGGFSQGQRIVVVTEHDTRQKIAELFDEAESVSQGLEPWIGSAPVLVVVGVREQDYHDRYTRPDKLQEGEEIAWPVPYWHFDAGAASMLILLAAIDEGYAAGLFGVPVESTEEFKNLLAIPDDVAVDCCITIGKPAADPNWSAVSSRSTQRRRPIDDLVHWERWS